MPKRVPLQTIVVQRDGLRVEAVPNQPFDFTAEEIKALANPGLLTPPAFDDLGPQALGDGDDGETRPQASGRQPVRPARPKSAADDL